MKKQDPTTVKTIEEELRKRLKSIKELRESTSNWITKSKAFKRVCKHVFEKCDINKTGAINQNELYTGVVLVHLTLAKYAGPAACYPASRETVYNLFKAGDVDNSGDIDVEEFETIMIITAASISSRIITYYSLILVLVPYIGVRIIDFLNYIGVDDGITLMDKIWDNNAPQWMQFFIDVVPDSCWLALPEQIISLFFALIVIPRIFDHIDRSNYKAAEARAKKMMSKAKKTN